MRRSNKRTTKIREGVHYPIAEIEHLGHLIDEMERKECASREKLATTSQIKMHWTARYKSNVHIKRRGIASVLGREVIRVMDKWQLRLPERAIILGVNPVRGEALTKAMRSGSLAKPSERLLRQMRHVLNIYAVLNLLYPFNADIQHHWMTSANRALNGQTPMSFVKRRGSVGLARLESMLKGFLSV